MEDHFHWYLRQHFVCFYVIAVLASNNLHGLILSNSLLGSWAEVAPSPLFCGKMWHSICSKPLFAQHKAQRKWRVMKNTARESFFDLKKKKKVLAVLHQVMSTGPYLGRGLPGRLWIWPPVLELGGAGHTLTESLHGTNRHRATIVGVCLGHTCAQACGTCAQTDGHARLCKCVLNFLTAQYVCMSAKTLRWVILAASSWCRY